MSVPNSPISITTNLGKRKRMPSVSSSGSSSSLFLNSPAASQVSSPYFSNGDISDADDDNLSELSWQKNATSFKKVKFNETEPMPESNPEVDELHESFFSKDLNEVSSSDESSESLVSICYNLQGILDIYYNSIEDFDPELLAEHVNDRNVNGDTLLHLAIENFDCELLDFLLENGANPNLLTSSKIDDTETDCIEEIGQLVPMQIAIIENSVDIFESLLNSEQINVNQQDASGNSILHFIAYFNRLDMLNLLLDSKLNLDLSLKNNKGETVFHALAGTHHNNHTNQLIECENYSMLLQSIIDLEKNQDYIVLDILDDAGNSPLHLAVNFGNREFVEKLLNNGNEFDLNLTENNGLTAKDLAHAKFTELNDSRSLEIVKIDSAQFVSRKREFINRFEILNLLSSID